MNSLQEPIVTLSRTEISGDNQGDNKLLSEVGVKGKGEGGNNQTFTLYPLTFNLPEGDNQLQKEVRVKGKGEGGNNQTFTLSPFPLNLPEGDNQGDNLLLPCSL